MDRVQALGAQGATDILPPDQKQTIASELTGLLQQLVSISDTATDGRYIFSGDADQGPAYLFDADSTPPYGIYLGTGSTREALHPAGTVLSVSLTAQQIFEDPDPSRNVFGSVEALRQALLNGDTAAISGALSQVRTASVHLNNQLAFYGDVQNQIASGLDYASKHELSLQTQITATEEADLTQAIVDLNQGQLHQQATLQAQAKVQQLPSLFDYLG
jgi:flagellar hook-associated protein 3 FlgL